jgi:hypothetical protein
VTRSPCWGIVLLTMVEEGKAARHSCGSRCEEATDLADAGVVVPGGTGNRRRGRRGRS